jgi:hypothetical protein
VAVVVNNNAQVSAGAFYWARYETLNSNSSFEVTLLKQQQLIGFNITRGDDDERQ